MLVIDEASTLHNRALDTPVIGVGVGEVPGHRFALDAGGRYEGAGGLAFHRGADDSVVHRSLARHGLVGSMGQVGSAGDNAAMESSCALLQKNVLNRRHLVSPCARPMAPAESSL